MQVLADLALPLRTYFQDQNVYLVGLLAFYYREGDPQARCVPDLLVIKGLSGKLIGRHCIKTWVEGVPSVIFELTSRQTGEEDTGPKKELYERLGVREYFLFDPRSEYLPRQLMGYRLVKVAEGNGAEVRQQYDELAPAADCSLPSAELGLRLVPRGQSLQLVNLWTGERLLPYCELAKKVARYRQMVDQTEQRAEQDLEVALRQAEQARKQSAEDHRLREEALKQSQEAANRAEQAQKDLAAERRERERLQAELDRLRGGPPAGPPPGEGG
jgi:hypothetical protein